MMFHVTKAEINNKFDFVVSLPATLNIQTLISGENINLCLHGKYGKICAIYVSNITGHIAFTQGYSPFGNINSNLPENEWIQDVLTKYQKKAEKAYGKCLKTLISNSKCRLIHIKFHELFVLACVEIADKLYKLKRLHR